VDEFQKHLEDNLRQIVVTRFVETIETFERTGIRRDIILGGVELALKQLREDEIRRQF
jgi:hypothetical protein